MSVVLDHRRSPPPIRKSIYSNQHHVPDLLDKFHAMFKNGECCDVTLKCSDGMVKAPGLILASVCPVLRQLGEYLTAEMDVNILLPDFKENDISNFLTQLMSPIPWPNGDISVFETVLDFFQRNSLSQEGRNLITQREFSDNNTISEDVHSEGAISVSNSDDDDAVVISDNTKAEVQRTEPNDYDLSSNCNTTTTTIFRYHHEEEEEEYLQMAENRNSLNVTTTTTELVQHHHRRQHPLKKKSSKSKTSNKKISVQAKKTFNEDLGLYICPYCNLQLKAGMTNHLKWHKEHPNDIYPSRSTCESCGKTFKKIGILRAHIIRMHTSMPKKFKCTFEGCEKAFKMRGELNTHYLTHTDAKNFICQICGLGFRTKMAMDSHTLRKHTNLKPSIPCEECGKLFRVRSDLYSHAMTHKARKERIHRCDDGCNLTFRTDKSLARHRELHDPTRPLACPKCPLRYKNKDQLVRHVQTHEKPQIQCLECHRVFGRPDHLKRHITTKHASLSTAEQMYLSESLSKRKHPRGQSGSSVKTSSSQELTTTVSTISTNLPGMMISLSHKDEPRQQQQQQRTERELSTVSVVDLETVTTSFTTSAAANPAAAFLPSNNSISATSNLSPSNSNIQFRPPLPPPYAPAAVFQLSLPPTTM